MKSGPPKAFANSDSQNCLGKKEMKLFWKGYSTTKSKTLNWEITCFILSLVHPWQFFRETISLQWWILQIVLQVVVLCLTWFEFIGESNYRTLF